MKMSNKTYDIIKFVAQYILPSIGTIYAILAEAWGLPYAGQVVGTISAIDAFVGMMLGVSTARYKNSEDYGDGVLQVDTTSPVRDLYRINLNIPFEEIRDKTSITLKVDPNANLNSEE